MTVIASTIAVSECLTHRLSATTDMRSPRYTSCWDELLVVKS
ncbi:MAG: hypothetical protein DCF19_19670 [Pseudanabaena frigida]|uniref:DUF4113 domain-containing protein n=1 Tax=Pseudanabaena frigida TaxID=945775 RepID=A0A2W4Y195_9CYAN|nr:MAG: hypothetical protein DCF19_19670 [Pseudanabaena frigida]